MATVKIGTTELTLDDNLKALTKEELRTHLRNSGYPEVANATVRETGTGDSRVVEFLEQPGRKG